MVGVIRGREHTIFSSLGNDLTSNFPPPYFIDSFVLPVIRFWGQIGVNLLKHRRCFLYEKTNTLLNKNWRLYAWPVRFRCQWTGTNCPSRDPGKQRAARTYYKHTSTQKYIFQSRDEVCLGSFRLIQTDGLHFSRREKRVRTNNDDRVTENAHIFH